VRDSVVSNDESDSAVVSSPVPEWIPINLTQNETSTLNDYVVIDKPTASIVNNSGLEVELAGDAFSSTSTHSTSTWVIRDAITKNPVYTKTTPTDLTTHHVGRGILAPSTQYEASVRYSNNGFGESAYSPWSDFVSFTTQVTDTLIPRYETSSVVTTGVIDAMTATVFRVDGTVNRTLTLSNATLPATSAQSIVVFIDGSGGTVTWPIEVSWAGGNEPVLGTTWTNVILFWTGTMWIGMESSKR
jgi:hypothetical protein